MDSKLEDLVGKWVNRDNDFAKFYSFHEGAKYALGYADHKFPIFRLTEFTLEKVDDKNILKIFHINNPELKDEVYEIVELTDNYTIWVSEDTDGNKTKMKLIKFDDSKLKFD